MRKLNIVLFFIVIISFCQLQQAKGQAFSKHLTSVSVGYGVYPFFKTFQYILYYEGGSTHIRQISTIGPYYLKFEKGISKDISIGLNLAYIKREVEVSAHGHVPAKKDQFKSLSGLIRINGHIGQSNFFDPYIGAGIGFRDGEEFLDKHGDYSFPVGFELSGGIRCFILPILGIYIEAGLAKSLLQGGLILSFTNTRQKESWYTE